MKTQISIDEHDIVHLEKAFNIDSKINPSKLLLDVLMKSTNDISNDLFFKYLYVDNDHVKECAKTVLSSLLDDFSPFKLVHGYSKNGKSTFLQYVKYLNNNKSVTDRKYRLVIYPINFEIGTDSKYLEKVVLLFLKEFNFRDFENFSQDCDEFRSFNNFILEFKDEINNSIDNSEENKDYSSNQVSNYFDNFAEELLEDIDDIIIKCVSDKKYYKRKFKKSIKSLVSEESCGELFSVIILFKTFKARYKLFYNTTVQTKLIFLLDNLDDYITDKDIFFFQKPQLNFSTLLYHLKSSFVSNIFSTCLKSSINFDEGIADWNFSFTTHFNVTYVFRTANFLVFSNAIQQEIKRKSQSNERFYPKLLLNEKYLRFNSINYTDEILSKRLIFAESLFKAFDIQHPQAFIFLKALTNNFSEKNKEDGDSKSIFSLWNGDKGALLNSINNQWTHLNKIFFKNEKTILNIINNSFLDDKYLLKGIYIYFFLYLLNAEHKTLLETIYSYRKNSNSTKNIIRFILNLTINKSETPSRNGDSISSINTISQKGIGLLDLLSDVNEFKEKVNRRAKTEKYSYDGIKKFFINSYNDKIDYFVHLFTIYKSQIFEDADKRIYSNYYCLEKELDEFYNAKNFNDIKHLNNIRVFNNYSATFLSSFLFSHFELYSFCLSHNEEEKRLTIIKPLPFAVEIKKDNIDGNHASKFEFYDIIENVYNSIDNSINKTVDFYVSYMTKDYPPNAFVHNPLFSTFNREKQKGDFQFRLHTSRHITYIESFRRGIVEDKIVKLSEADKVIVNIYLTEKILDYISLYERNYNKISIATNRKSLIGTDLESTYVYLQRFRILAKKILDSEGKDFDTEIYVKSQNTQYEKK